MTARQRGFTLIELMIVIAIIGVLAAIAIPAFIEYMNKGKRVEPYLQLDYMEKKIKTYQNETSKLPADAALTPSTTACASTTGKIPKIKQSDWASAGTGWAEMQFHIDDDLLFQYAWDQVNATTGGNGTAVGDLDCDGTLVTFTLKITVAEGNLQAEQIDGAAD